MKKQDSQKAFQTLQSLGQKTAIYSSIEHLLSWDQETYMPSGAIEFREEQMALMAEVIHKAKTSKKYKNALTKIIDPMTGQSSADLNAYQSKAAELWHDNWQKDAKRPLSFMKKKARLAAQSVHAWSQAKSENNFKKFSPFLQKTLTLARKEADLLGYEDHPYDALLDLYEPGMRVATLAPLFADLKTALQDLLKKISRAKAPDPLKLGSFDVETQRRVGAELLGRLGLKAEFSRLDTSNHPFCMPIAPKDMRLTTKIIEDNPISNILSVMHECGHGLYHSQLPVEYYGTPLFDAASFGVDESQSRLFETIVGRSQAFWDFFYPQLQKAFPEQLQGITLEAFYRHIHEVKPSCIRVEADEVTYCLHVLLRFEIEKALIEGSIDVEDIPSFWNEKMQDSLGILPSTDAEGCLQDIHWACGCFGYFPSYALGNLFAAQLYETLRSERPEVENQIAKGEFSPLCDWLKESVHHHGKLYTPTELSLKVTKKPLCIEAYMNYLNEKYVKIYDERS